MPLTPFKEPSGFIANIWSGPDERATIDAYELRFARRALQNLRERLGPEAVEKLLRPDIDESDSVWQRITTENIDHEWKPAQVEMSYSGIGPQEFLHWYHVRRNKDSSFMTSAHPEHFMMQSGEDDTVRIIENIGELLSRFTVAFEPPSESCVFDAIREDYPFRMIGRAVLDTGDTIAHIIHQLRPHSGGDGFDADLCMFFPATTPDELIEQHRQHLVVEFTNWARFCYQELKVEKSQI